jgi:hypothetical protein
MIRDRTAGSEEVGVREPSSLVERDPQGVHPFRLGGVFLFRLVLPCSESAIWLRVAVGR